ncbi:hypothetical protein D3C76_1734360 [compost metagenome]
MEQRIAREPVAEVLASDKTGAVHGDNGNSKATGRFLADGVHIFTDQGGDAGRIYKYSRRRKTPGNIINTVFQLFFPAKNDVVVT